MAKLKSEYVIQCVSLLREKEGQKERERGACCDPSGSGCNSLTQEAVVTDTACFPQECVALWRDMIIGGQGVLLLTVLAEK